MFEQQQIFQSKIDIKSGGSSISDDFPVTLNIMSQSIQWKPVFWDSEKDVALSGKKRSNIRGYDVMINLDYDRMLEPDKLKTILDGIVESRNQGVNIEFYPDASNTSEFFTVIPSGDTSRVMEYEDTLKKGESPSLSFESDSIVSQVDSSSASPSVGDADTLDGLDSTQFLRSDADDVYESGNTLELRGVTEVYNNLDMKSNRIQSVSNPVNNADVANKAYVDKLVNGLDWQESVIDEINDPSTVSPSDGDRYLVGESPVGDFSGHSAEIAIYNGSSSSWEFVAPDDGTTLEIESNGYVWIWNGTDWVRFGSSVSHNQLQDLDASDHMTGLSGVDKGVLFYDQSTDKLDTDSTLTFDGSTLEAPELTVDGMTQFGDDALAVSSSLPAIKMGVSISSADGAGMRMIGTDSGGSIIRPVYENSEVSGHDLSYNHTDNQWEINDNRIWHDGIGTDLAGAELSWNSTDGEIDFVGNYDNYQHWTLNGVDASGNSVSVDIHGQDVGFPKALTLAGGNDIDAYLSGAENEIINIEWTGSTGTDKVLTTVQFWSNDPNVVEFIDNTGVQLDTIDLSTTYSLLGHGHSASEVDAVSASSGGTFSGKTTHQGGIVASGADTVINDLRIVNRSSGVAIDSDDSYLLLQRDEEYPIEIWGSKVDIRSELEFKPNGNTRGSWDSSGKLTAQGGIESNAPIGVDSSDIIWDSNSTLSQFKNNAFWGIEPNGKGLAFGVGSSNHSIFSWDGTTNHRMVNISVDGTGVGIKTTPSEALDVNGNINVSGVSYADDHAESDSRIKSNITDADPLEVAQLAQLKTFDHRDKEGEQLGLIADHFDNAHPSLIHWKKDGEFGEIRTLNTYGLASTALAGVGKLHTKQKTQTELITQLRNRVAKLEQENENLKQKIA